MAGRMQGEEQEIPQKLLRGTRFQQSTQTLCEPRCYDLTERSFQVFLLCEFVVVANCRFG